MQPRAIKQLIQLFQRLPGVGPRQASRFAYALLDESPDIQRALRHALAILAEDVERCPTCFRAKEKGKQCESCKFEMSAYQDIDSGGSSSHRILVVEKDQDVETIEKSGLWRGAYHVAGGLISPLREDALLSGRLRGLHERVARLASTQKEMEIVMAFSATPQGEATQRYLEKILEPFCAPKGPVKITSLARGLSTGAEIEYADPGTLSHALKNRK
jgi:recombination protein RecR